MTRVGDNRKDSSPKLFRISPQSFIDIWKYASQDSGVRVTPQVPRAWFCDEMGRLGVPDRYVDAFCGRVPKSVLAKRYIDFAPDKIKHAKTGWLRLSRYRLFRSSSQT